MANFELINQRLDALEEKTVDPHKNESISVLVAEIKKLSHKIASNKARLTKLEISGKKTVKKSK